jgi:hypothetical protein
VLQRGISNSDNETEAGSAEEFFEAEEIFSNSDSHDEQKDSDMISITSTDYAPSGEPRESSPFSNIELGVPPLSNGRASRKHSK